MILTTLFDHVREIPCVSPIVLPTLFSYTYSNMASFFVRSDESASTRNTTIPQILPDLLGFNSVFCFVPFLPAPFSTVAGILERKISRNFIYLLCSNCFVQRF